MRPPDLEHKSFLLLLAVVTIAFLAILFPLFGAVMWAVALAILFDPMHERILRRLKGRPNWAAVCTVLVVLVLVILPSVITAVFVVQEGSVLVERLRSGEIDLASYYQRLVDVMPDWMGGMLERFGLADLPALQKKLSASAAQGTQPIAMQVWLLSQAALDFAVSFVVMLYLLFFFLRDGEAITQRIRRAAPLNQQQQKRLLGNFTAVIRATVKGNVVVAALQGALGGLALLVLGIPGAFLWGVVMAFLSLLPAVGAALVWGPVAIYLLVTGAVWKGVALIAFGTFVIGLVDNLLRPMLVGKDTKLPDWVVLVTTLGGMSLFGLNGFVIGPVIAAMFIAAWDLSATSRATGDT